MRSSISSIDKYIHPEIREGEIFLINCNKDTYYSLKFRSKRLGTSTFDGNGNIFQSPDWFPVFISDGEFDSFEQLIQSRRNIRHSCKKH